MPYPTSDWYPEHLAERLRQFAADKVLCLGVQASVSYGGVSRELCFGSAGPDLNSAPDVIWRLFCAAKPVVAVAVALLAQQGRIDLCRPVAEQLGPDQLPTGMLAAGHVTPLQLLNHTAGLHQLHGFGIGAQPPDVRHSQVAALGQPPGWDSQRQAGYSEYAAWHVLGMLIEAASGQPASQFLRNEVCGPFASGEMWFAMEDGEYRSLYPRLAVAYDLRCAEPTPMLANRSRRPCTEANMAYGGYGTARGLRQFYETMLSVLQARSSVPLAPAKARQLVQRHRGRRWDPVLRRSCDWGLGFMVDLADHGFEGYVSPSAFGHTGYFGTTLGLADPARDLAVAIVWNGIVDGDLGVRTRRNAALRALYRDLDGSVDPMAPSHATSFAQSTAEPTVDRRSEPPSGTKADVADIGHTDSQQITVRP